jgi:hypothetical protein
MQRASSRAPRALVAALSTGEMQSCTVRTAWRRLVGRPMNEPETQRVLPELVRASRPATTTTARSSATIVNGARLPEDRLMRPLLAPALVLLAAVAARAPVPARRPRRPARPPRRRPAPETPGTRPAR